MSRSTGAIAEKSAQQFLQSQGLSSLFQNYQCKMGEIDLIMKDKDELVFIEVRSRTHHEYGSAAETVDINKQRKLIRAAKYFLMENHHRNLPCCRFDVIEFNQQDTQQKINWIKDAFQLQGFSVL